MLRRMGWGIADQALSSLTNFALGIVVARTVDTTVLGAFAFAFLAYAIGLGVNRAIAAQPLVIRYSATEPARWASGVAVAGGVALWVGVPSAFIAVAIAALASDSLREAFLALALVFPGLLYQDTWRYAFFAESRAAFAFLNDLIWTIVLIPALWASLVLWPGSVGGPLLAWAAPRRSPARSDFSRHAFGLDRSERDRGCANTSTSSPDTSVSSPSRWSLRRCP